jgi:hypothetical protein
MPCEEMHGSDTKFTCQAQHLLFVCLFVIFINLICVAVNVSNMKVGCFQFIKPTLHALKYEHKDIQSPACFSTQKLLKVFEIVYLL